MITRYEIAATLNGNRHFVDFTARKTKRSLINNTMRYGEQIALALGCDRDAVCIKADTNEVVMSDGTRIFFTGRTELDIARGA